MRTVRPLTVLAVLLLFVNDHVLKHAWPGFVTGKLSDVAGVFFFPLLVHALVWTVVPASRRDDRAHDRLLLCACVATAIVFTLTKTTVLGNEAYRVTWGAMQWPLRAARAIAHGSALPGIKRVVLVRDPSDVIAVPFAALAYLYARTRPALSRPPSEALLAP